MEKSLHFRSRKEMLQLVRNHHLALPLTVAFVPSEKLYYGKYLYKVRLPNASPWHNNRLFADGNIQWHPIFGGSKKGAVPSPEANRIRNMLFNCDLWLKENNLGKLDDYKIRKELTVNFFFNDPKHVELFVTQFEEYTIDVHGPVNDQQKLLMIGEDSIVIKTKRWHNKYRYKLTYMGSHQFQDSDCKQIANYIHEQGNKGEEFYLSPNFKRALGLFPEDPFRPHRNYIYQWSLCSLYCLHYEDVIMLKMMSGESLSKVEKCVTYEELESDK